MSQPDYGTYGGLIQGGLDIVASIFQAKAAKKAQKAQIAQSASMNDFPQLGMGLAASGPSRAQNPFYTPGSPMGQIMNYFGGDNVADPNAVQVMRGSRFPTQLVVYTTPSGQMQVGGYRSIGRPLLWSGDFAAVKRVARVARKLGRFTRHRSHPR